MQIALLLLWFLGLGAASAWGLEVQASPAAQAPDAITAEFGTSFTYQGHLQEDGVPANGIYDFEFQLFERQENGDQVSEALQVEDVLVTEGNFTVELDFGPHGFNGATRFLEIRVRPGKETGKFVALSPLQKLTAAPLALSLPGFYTEAISGTFNIFTGAATQGGSPNTNVKEGVVGAWVGGGIGVGQNNSVTDHYGLVMAGADNKAGDNDANPTNAIHAIVVGGTTNLTGATLSAIVGGSENTIAPGATFSFIGGGLRNLVSGEMGMVGGGSDNQALGRGASVLGGQDNRATDIHATVGGGVGNRAGNDDGNPDNVPGATVAGGSFNSATGPQAVVSGGSNNRASGIGAAVPGGILNVAAGDHSFAAGKSAKARHSGSFVWSDGTREVESSAPNQFAVLASGGVLVATGDAGVVLSPGSGAWAGFSDRNAKENFAPVDGLEVLEKVAALPISTWNYKSQERAIRHMGPMAQDFYAAFQLGEDDRHIVTIDADGVALAAIQGLYQLSQAQQAQIDALQAENAALTEQLAQIENRLDVLEAVK